MAAVVENDEHAHKERGGRHGQRERHNGVTPPRRYHHHRAQQDVRNESLKDFCYRLGPVRLPERLNQRIQVRFWRHPIDSTETGVRGYVQF